jgi:hypothetical protein
MYRSASPFVEPVTTVLLWRPEAQGEPSTPFTLLWTRPSSRGWNEPGVLVGPGVPAAGPRLLRAAEQTRRHLRAGHRAEPVDLQVPLPSARAPRRLPSFLCPVAMERTRGFPQSHAFSGHELLVTHTRGELGR